MVDHEFHELNEFAKIVVVALLQVGLEELEDALLGAERTAMGNIPELGFEERVGPL